MRQCKEIFHYNLYTKISHHCILEDNLHHPVPPCSRTSTPDPDMVMDANNNNHSHSKDRATHNEMMERQQQEPRRAPSSSLRLPEPETFDR